MPGLHAISPHEESGHSLADLRTMFLRYSMIDIDGDDQVDNFASISHRSYAAVGVTRFDLPNVIVKRTRTAVSRDKIDLVTINYVAAGSIHIRQCGRASWINQHDCFIIDFNHPFESLVQEACSVLALQVPRTWFARYLPPEDTCARRVDGSGGWGAPLSAYLRAFYDDFEPGFSLSPRLIVDQALHLVELAFHGQARAGTTHQKGILRRAQAIMRDLCSDEDLTPAMVAAEVGVSRVYLHRIFAQSGTTFCRQLDALRIDQATALLETPSKRHLTINEIGTRCGLPNSAHFARKFRSLKGMTPTQYRQLCLEGADPAQELVPHVH